MAEKNYKINETIDVIYQAPNKESGLSGVVAEILLPNGAPDSGFPDVALTERGNTGTYHGQFTPNAVGDWQLIIHKASGDGQVTKRYSVGNYNIHTIGEVVGTVDGKCDTIDGKADTTHSKIDAIDTKVSALDTPPMVS